MIRFWPFFKSQVLVCYAAMLIFMFIVVHFLSFDVYDRRYATKCKTNNTSTFLNTSEVELNLIPCSVLPRWRRTYFLVVMGIPSEDIPARRRRRELQRKTCWTYDGVARKKNNYTGSMLVLYVLAHSAENSFNFSVEHKEEAEKWHDIVKLSLNEGKKSTRKKIGGDGFWGLEAEIGMSRKTYFWYYMASKLFPLASYIAKGDDDMFFRVPMYLATLRILPKKGLYWGYGARLNYNNGTATTANVFYAFGMCITLSADLIEQFIKYQPISELVRTPYSERLKDVFLYLRMHHEDEMLGAVLNNTGYQDIVYASEKSCRFHNIHTGSPICRVTLDSMVIHHLKEEEYEIFMNIFANVKGSFVSETYRKENTINFPCREGLPTLYPSRG